MADDIPYNTKYPNMRVTKETMANLRWVKASTGESYLAIMARLVTQELNRLGITPPTTDKETKMSKPKFEVKHIDGHDVATITYSDGTMFTPIDWQSQQPKTVKEIPQYTWYRVNPANPGDTDQWTPAVMLSGYPRIME